MKRRWRMLSFRVGVLGTAALAALVAAAALLTGREPLAAALLLCAAAGLGAVAWLCVVRPYRAQERAMLMFLEGYTPPRQDAACALSPAQARLQEQVAAILNPEQLFNLNKRQAQYQALQNQINPHFLYNTLESIRGEHHRRHDRSVGYVFPLHHQQGGKPGIRGGRAAELRNLFPYSALPLR